MSAKREHEINYTHHNYDYYNHAASLNIEKQRELMKITRYKRREHVLRSFVYVVLVICLVALTIMIILKLNSSGFSGFHSSNNGDQVGDQAKLQELVETQGSKEKPFGVTSKFNIFNTQYMGSGEAVITSKEDLPSDLTKPDWQYCYIGNNQGQMKTLLATQKKTEFTVKINDEYLLKNALPLCTFVKVD